MNINKLINEIKKKVGLIGHLSTVISDKGIRDIIYMSLDEFNRVSSYPVRIPLKPYVNDILNFQIPIFDYRYNNNMIEQEISPDILKLCNDSGVIIKDVRLHRDSATPMAPQSMTMKQDMTTLNMANMRALNTQKPTLRVRMPNILIIENYSSNLMYYQSYNMELRMTHPKTLATIDIGLERWFEELCRRNVEMVLYNNNLRFLNIDIGSVRVELNIDNFQSAEKDKEELLEKMRTRAAADEIVFTVN